MNILITEQQHKLIKEAENFKTPSLESFIKEVKLFLYNLISANGDKEIKSNFWRFLGKNDLQVANLLKKFGIVSDLGLPNPKNDFEKNVKRLYYHLFPEQEEDVIEEDFGGNCASGVGGSYVGPIGEPVTKNYYPENTKK